MPRTKTQKNEDIAKPLDSMNDAQMGHSMGNPAFSATIKEFGCVRNGFPCEHLDNCAIKTFMDNFLWDCLRSDVSASVTIKFCGHYYLPTRKRSIDVENTGFQSVEGILDGEEN